MHERKHLPRSRKLAAMASLILGLCGPAMAQDAGDLRVEEAWVREPPVLTTSAGAYFELYNDGNRPAVLVEVTSPAFGEVSMHRSIRRGGQWMMDTQYAVTVAPGDKVEFKPGGLHLMLEKGVEPVQTGQQIELTFVFRDGRQLTTTAEVRRQR